MESYIGFSERYEESQDGFQDVKFDGTESFDFIYDILKENGIEKQDEILPDMYRLRSWYLKVKHYSNNQKSNLIKRVTTGDRKAKLELFYYTFSRVVYLANQFKHCGLSLSDLINEGNIGAWKALDKLDDSGFQVRTPASYWIVSSIKEALNKYGSMVCCPFITIMGFNKFQQYIDTHISSIIEIPANDTIALELHIPIATIEDYTDALWKPISLDSIQEHFNNNEGFENYITRWSGGIIVDEDPFYQTSLTKDINKALNKLYDREREILKAFFGIGCVEMSLEEIGMKFDLSSERVRQIKEKAIRRLKGQKSKELRQYLD